MSWGNIPVSCAGATEDGLEPLVREVVRTQRRNGLKAADAVAAAAELLGLSARTVRALHEGELCRGRGIDLEDVRARYAAHLDAEAQRLEAALEALRVRQAAVRERIGALA